MAFTAVPALLYVLSQNTPQTEGGFLVFLSSQTIIVAALQTSFAALLNPKMAELLVKLRYGRYYSSIHHNVRIHTAKVTCQLLLELVGSLLAPMLGVFVLDDACLRYYLEFSPGLQKVMVAWNIGDDGAAYRIGFCSRQLVSRFTYIWISMMMLSTFLGPTLLLLKSHPLVSALQEEVSRRWSDPREQGTYIQTLGFTGAVQKQAVTGMVQVIAAAVFGCLVPPLICLLPLLIFSQLCALAVAREAQQVHFGVTLASNILVQKPLNVFRYLCFVSSCCVNIWIFIDSALILLLWFYLLS